MKKLIIPFLSIVAFGALAGCKTEVVERRDSPVHSSTTTTEETSIHRPVQATTTTETRSLN